MGALTSKDPNFGHGQNKGIEGGVIGGTVLGTLLLIGLSFLPMDFVARSTDTTAIDFTSLNSQAAGFLIPSTDVLKSRVWRTCTDREGATRNISPVLDIELPPYIVVDWNGNGTEPFTGRDGAETFAVYNLNLAEAMADTLESSVGKPQLLARKMNAVQGLQDKVAGDFARVLDGLKEVGVVKGFKERGEDGLINGHAAVEWDDMFGAWRKELNVQDGIFTLLLNETGDIEGLRCPS